jgi:2-methylcitrate dehydratase PrpD
MEDTKWSRRGFLQVAGATGVGLTTIPISWSMAAWGAQGEKTYIKSGGNVMEEVSSYVSKSGEFTLPPDVANKAKQHVLDTLASIVSGSKFKSGQLAINFARNQGGVQEAQVVGSNILTSTINAAMVNGIMAHADETDDSHEKSNTHPGCSIVPAALAIAEREQADGWRFLKGVVAGYDIGCRINQSLGVKILLASNHSTHAIGGTFGAAAAASALLRLKETQVRYVFDYAAQQASGIYYWVRDTEHIEKAFVFAGMPARNGVTGAILVHSGFTGVDDCFSGDRNFFDVFSTNSQPELLAEGLGRQFEIMFTNIKKYSVGSPIQAPLDALSLLIKKHGVKARNVQSITALLPSKRVVDNREMPDVNLQYILSVTLVDGGLTFEAAHSYQRMKDPAVLEMKERLTVVEDPQLATAESVRTGIVEIVTKDGAKLREHVTKVRGTFENPMTTEEVEAKCRELLKPVLGEDRTQKLIDKIWNLERVGNMRELRPLLSAS